MIEKTLLAFWGVWLLILLCAAFRVFGFSVARRAQDRRWRRKAGTPRPVALILPVKGFDLQATPRFFDAIFDQDYPHYRVLVCFESWDDPVALWLCEHLDLGPNRRVWTHPDPDKGLRSVTLTCGGISATEGQKVHNQRAAFADLNDQDAIVAFADADILCGRDWLRRLVAPLNAGTHELSTTYRWLVPRRPTLPNQFASVINASITTQGGAEWCTVLWGGSMALTRAVFRELDVPTLLEGSLNDDLRLSKAARATGRRIAFVRSLILPTPVDFTWRGFFEFARRQYTQVKFFSPILYSGVNFVLGLYMLGAVSIVAALVYGYFYAWVPVAAAYVLDQFRALARQQIYLGLFPDPGIRQKLLAASWLEHMLTPLWMGLHWLLLAGTWTQNRLTWAGVTYRIRSMSKTLVLGRREIRSPLPAGAPGLAMIGELHDRPRTTIFPSRTPVEAEALVPATTATPEGMTRPAAARTTPLPPPSQEPDTAAALADTALAATAAPLADTAAAGAQSEAVDTPSEAAAASTSVPTSPTPEAEDLAATTRALLILAGDPHSAILPLATAFAGRTGTRRPRSRRPPGYPDKRPAAVAAVLRKTRVRPLSLSLPEPQSPGLDTGTGMAESKVLPPSSGLSRPGLPRSRADKLREKHQLSRIPSLEPRSEPAPARERPRPGAPYRHPSAPALSTPALSTPALSTPAPLVSGKPPSPRPAAIAPGRAFSNLAGPAASGDGGPLRPVGPPTIFPSSSAPRPFPGSSLAARRSGRPPGAVPEFAPKALPALSGRAVAASSATAPRSPRPMARGASARP